MFAGIGWVSELIEIAGGDAKDRIVTPDAIAATLPDVILASWCGKKVVPDPIRSRPGWDQIPAVTETASLRSSRR